MKQGYDVFGKAYGVMMRNDLHDSKLVDHQFLRDMIRLDEESYPGVYAHETAQYDMKTA